MSSSSQEFWNSWIRAEEYPSNVVLRASNNGALEAHKKLLVEKAPEIFKVRSKVPVIEVSGREVGKCTHSVIENDVLLSRWLGIPDQIAIAKKPDQTSTGTEEQDGQNDDKQANISEELPGDENQPENNVGPQAQAPRSQPASTHPESPDIRCRFVFFQAKTVQARLDVSLGMARKILTYFQVMPSYIDFMSVFAVKRGQLVEVSDLRFSGFRERVQLSGPELSVPHLGLTGHGYQLCYNLKCVGLKYDTGPREDWQWSPRPGSFHHQFDSVCGTSLWIMTSRIGLKERVENLTGPNGRPQDKDFRTPEASFISSLAVHILLAQWATEDWRGYIRWLEQVIEEKTQNVLNTAAFIPNESDLAFVQAKEDDVNKTTMMLESNAEVLHSLQKFYVKISANPHFPLAKHSQCKDALADFDMQLNDYIQDFRMHAARAKTLSKITADRKALVQQYLQADATSKMEKLTEESKRETIVMRIIALITLFYLPATFVSTFFSTDVVHYNTNNALDESYSSLALERWVEVTLPLTFVTFVLAGGWLYWAKVKELSRAILELLNIVASHCFPWKRNRISLRDEEKAE